MASLKRKIVCSSGSSCPICREKLSQELDPVKFALCECEIMYCRECLEKWLNDSNTKCPTCSVTVKITRNSRRTLMESVHLTDATSSDESDSEVTQRTRQIAKHGEVGEHFRELENKRLCDRLIKDDDEISSRVASELMSAEEESRQAKELKEIEDAELARRLQEEEDKIVREQGRENNEATEKLARDLQAAEDARLKRERDRREKLDLKEAKRLAKLYSSSSSSTSSGPSDEPDDSDDDESESDNSSVIYCGDSDEDEA